MKKCSCCNIIKDLSYFSKSSKSKDGYECRCKQCDKNRYDNYSKSKKGLINKIFRSQKQHSRDRGMDIPIYTLNELYDWVVSQDNFDGLYNAWIDSNYEKDLVPSINRIDDYKSYSLDNIEIITFKENRLKANEDMKNGTNNKQSKKIVVYKNDSCIEFHSIAEASRYFGLSQAYCSMLANSKKFREGEKWEIKSEFY